MKLRSWAHRAAVLCVVIGFAALSAACGLTQAPPKKTLPRPTTTSTTATGPKTTFKVVKPPPPKYPGCRTGSDPRLGVNTPIRLLVRDRCVRVSGIAGCIFTDNGDGDTHIALLLSDRDAARYLTPGNDSWTCDSDQGSDFAPRLVIEVIPQHCTVRRDNCADRGHFTAPQIPRNGQHITVVGPWVQDTSHLKGRTLWSEIHPAWRITVAPNDPGVPIQGDGDYEGEGEAEGN
jgi:hypothetical protein